ncbi:MAG: sensor histidine kinase [Thiotrichales bacterium]|nr:sensor histidine kinase [Thiotrichales bacterium]
MVKTKLRGGSIQHQLLIGLGVSLVGVLALFWWVSQTALHKISEAYVLTRLAHDKDLVAEHLVYRNQRWWMNSTSIGPIYLSPESGHYYAIKTPQQAFFSPSLGNYPLYLKPSTAALEVYETLGPKGQSLLVRSEQLQKDGQVLRVFTAENHDPIQQMVLRYDLLFALLTLLTLLSLYGLHRWLLKRAFDRLKPLETQLSAFRLGQGLDLRTDAFPQEVHSLLQALQLALEKSRLQFEQSRQRNSDVSHSLKTPLNLLFQLLETPSLNPELKTALQKQSERILQLIERELKFERFAYHQVFNPLPIAPVIDDLQASFARLYADKPLRFVLDGQKDVCWLLDREDAYELLGNLLDNACKWAKSTVYVQFSAQKLVIEDDGPGVSAQQLSQLTERGYRADETKPGHGLGLAMVKQLAAVYRAQLTLEHSVYGGLRVCLHFSSV